ncbi:MAG: FAD-binding oxidoreductase [Chloroflexi bacterium]|nr:FAD-binding oxidoreductase [Chloroflexota bacterium]
MEVKRAAEVIIIGAGVTGTSIAYHLAKAGCRDVVVLEKDLVGEGSSCKSGGGVRQQFCSEANVRLSIESVKFFQHFEEETGCDCEFKQVGYLMVMTNEKELETFRESAAMQRSLGVDVQMISPQEARDVVPALNIDDVIGATFCPTDGRLNDYALTQGFATAGRRLGVKIYQHVEVTGIEMTGSTKKLSTNEGSFESPHLVAAAGAFSPRLGRLIGLRIPAKAVKQHGFFTVPTNELRRDAPHIIDATSHLGVSKHSEHVRFSVREHERPETFDISIEWDALPKYAEVVVQRLPFMENVGIQTAHAGLKSNTPDLSAITGDVPGFEGLYLACGCSGHGIMHSPAIGRLMANLILSGNCPELLPFNIGRFGTGAYQQEDRWDTGHSGLGPECLQAEGGHVA